MSEKANYIEELKEKPELLKTLPKEYLADKDIIRAALVRNWHNYETNFEVLELFKLADATLRYNKDFVKELIASCSGYLFEYLPLALREDEGILLFALKHSGYEYIYDKMIEDAMPDGEDYDRDHVEDIRYDLFLHINQQMSVMQYAGETILNNKEVVLKTIALEEQGFYYFSDALKDDKEVAFEAVSTDASNFSFVSNRLKDDEEIALNAAYLSGEYWSEFDAYGRWVNVGYSFFDALSDRLKSDKSFLIKLINEIRGGEFALVHFAEEFKDDKDLVLLALSKNYTLIEYASERLKNDPDILALKVK